jgi:peptidoglycan/LPS O-acetylase OafA/YrhL
MGNGTNRLLFFDMLRIISIGLIVFFHIAIKYLWGPFCSDPVIFNIFHLGLGAIGVALLIFVSGAVLEYSHPKLNNSDEVAEFYVKRLFRIYPAFWMSIIIGLVGAPILLLRLRPFYLFLQVIGFNAWSGGWGGSITEVGWFIGLIVALYFLFPFLSASIRKYPYTMLFLITFVEIFTRYALNTGYFPLLMSSPDRWLPFCNFLEFGLGIWIVQQGFYPKWTCKSHWIRVLAELSFYVFLIHYLGLMMNLLNVSLVFYLVAVALVAWLMMTGDQKIQACLKRITGIK